MIHVSANHRPCIGFLSNLYQYRKVHAVTHGTAIAAAEHAPSPLQSAQEERRGGFDSLLRQIIAPQSLQAAAFDLKALLAGTNLFASQAVLEVLTATRVDPELGRSLALDGRHLLLANQIAYKCGALRLSRRDALTLNDFFGPGEVVPAFRAGSSCNNKFSPRRSAAGYPALKNRLATREAAYIKTR